MIRSLAVGLVSFALGCAYLAGHGAPEPIVHDEFSYLLAADTFAHGRLTNPEPRFWKNFQSVNELVRPSYMSKYPPGQGLLLALGRALAGQPLVGAIVGVAAAAAAIHWMLLAFLPAEWALAGGLLAATHPLLLLWMTNYWGGGGALLGGALFVGAWKRCLDAPSPRAGALLGAGAAILSQTRPLEGLLLAAPLSAFLAWCSRARMKKAGAAAFAVLSAAALWTAVYDARVTGDPFKLPYLLYEESYNPAPLFVWQNGLRPVPDPGVEEIRLLWRDWNLAQYERHRTPWGLKEVLLEKLGDFDEAWLEPLPIKLFVALPLIGLCGSLLGWLGAAWAAGTAVIFTLLFYYPHYSAPFGGLFFLLAAAGMRRCWEWNWRRRPVGRAAVAVAALWCLAYTVLFLGRKIENPRAAWSYFRREAVDRMRAMGGRHLVLVRYGKGATYHDDWVANDADIDASPVIWAWSLSPAEDRELADHYRDRFLWRLEVVPPRPVFRLERKP